MKQRFTKIAAILLAGVMMCGCAANNSGSGAETSTAVTEEAAAPVIDRGEMRGLDAKSLVSEMKTGWNLGNSLDAIGADETSWGNPVTTQEMIDVVKAQGFDVLRVPVTWGNHMGEAPDYTVEPEWMERVAEVVDYGIADGMYVIINTHHEPDTWLLPQSESMDEVVPQLTALWQQIAERFADYGDHLVFEGLNEPRIKGIPEEWTGGTEDGRACINKLNRVFYDTVRATGGNNAQRLLLISTYAQQVTMDAFRDFDTDYDEYTGVALHAYTPYSFTYHNGESWELFKWDGSEKKSIEAVFKIMDKYVLSKDIPVIITEYGSVTKTIPDEMIYNNDEVVKWVNDYLSVAKEYGVPCVWWDNNQYYSGNEHFGIFNRSELTWYSPKVADAIIAIYQEQ